MAALGYTEGIGACTGLTTPGNSLTEVKLTAIEEGSMKDFDKIVK